MVGSYAVVGEVGAAFWARLKSGRRVEETGGLLRIHVDKLIPSVLILQISAATAAGSSGRRRRRLH